MDTYQKFGTKVFQTKVQHTYYTMITLVIRWKWSFLR